jgi:hypothetical protein
MPLGQIIVHRRPHPLLPSTRGCARGSEPISLLPLTKKSLLNLSQWRLISRVEKKMRWVEAASPNGALEHSRKARGRGVAVAGPVPDMDLRAWRPGASLAPLVGVVVAHWREQRRG